MTTRGPVKGGARVVAGLGRLLLICLGLSGAPAAAQTASGSTAAARDAGEDAAIPRPAVVGARRARDAGIVAAPARDARPSTAAGRRPSADGGGPDAGTIGDGIQKVRIPQRRAGRPRLLTPAAVDAGPASFVGPPGSPSPSHTGAEEADAGLRAETAEPEAKPPPPTSSRLEPLPDVSPDGATSVLLWLLLIGAVLLSARTAELLAGYVSSRSAVQVTLRLVATAARGLGLLLALAMVARFAPGVGAYWPWLVAAMVALVVLAGKEILRDGLAHFVLRFEGRVQQGRRLEAGRIAGRVERVGIRVTQVVDDEGRVIDVPNHVLLQSPLVADSESWPTRRVQLRLGAREGVALREVLLDAVHASPWVPIGAQVTVKRDAEDPELWIVQAELLGVEYVERFAGDLGEQVEERLREIEARLSPGTRAVQR